MQQKANKRSTSQTEKTNGPIDEVQYYNHKGVDVPSNVLWMNHDEPIEECPVYEYFTSFTQLLSGSWDDTLPSSDIIPSENTDYSQAYCIALSGCPVGCRYHSLRVPSSSHHLLLPPLISDQ